MKEKERKNEKGQIKKKWRPRQSLVFFEFLELIWWEFIFLSAIASVCGWSMVVWRGEVILKEMKLFLTTTPQLTHTYYTRWRSRKIHCRVSGAIHCSGFSEILWMRVRRWGHSRYHFRRSVKLTVAGAVKLYGVRKWGPEF